MLCTADHFSQDILAQCLPICEKSIMLFHAHENVIALTIIEANHTDTSKSLRTSSVVLCAIKRIIKLQNLFFIATFCILFL